MIRIINYYRKKNKNLAIAPDNDAFWVNLGPVIKNLKELKEVLKTINDQQYSHHVNSQKNDFAKWVKEILRDADCSRELLRCQNRYAALKVVEKYLREYKNS